MPVQLTKQQAAKMGVEAAEQPVARRKSARRGASVPRAGRAERTGLSTLIRDGWSLQSPDSVRYRFYKIGQPGMDTGLCVDELTACKAAKHLLEKLR